MDLLGPNLMDDLVDTPAFTSTAMLNVGSAAAPEIDLFADADFQSANVPSEAATASGSHAQVCFPDLAIYFYHKSFSISYSSL
jgi:epsin